MRIRKYPQKIILNKSKNITNFFDYSFSDARTCLKYGIKLYKLSNTEILVPEYVCNEVIDTLNSLGMVIKYYEINDMLIPNYDNIKSKINSKVKSIVFINYFGLPLNLTNNIQFSKEHNLLMIEDNAHGFSGKFNNQYLGTFGDISINSPRKNLNIMCGGFLFIKNKNLLKNFKISKKKITFKWRIFRYLPIFICNIVINLINFLNIKKNINYKNSNKYLKNIIQDINSYMIDDYSHYLINHQDYTKLNSIKREIFSLWYNFFVTYNFKIINIQDPQEFSPMCIAININNIKNKINLLNIFLKNNIAAYQWPELPEKIYKKKGNGYNLKKNIICVPITYEISISKIKNKISILKNDLNAYIK